jgi:hypothetical protein
VKTYKTVETNQRVKNIDPDLITRFRWRADRRASKLNSFVKFPSYRWEVVDWLDGRWAVVALQNIAVPVED